MAESSIPVNLFNPGQVFACLGFLEAADVLCGDAEGGFDWNNEANVVFCLRANGGENPFKAVLEILAGAKAKAVAPKGWLSKKGPAKTNVQKNMEEFPSRYPDTSSALPIEIANDKIQVVLGHWADGSKRNNFKLYAGNRSALQIADNMLQKIDHLWKEHRDDIIEQPFDVTVAMGGSFNFDPRGGWTAIDAGYSPNDHKHQIAASPVVELFAAWGMENARPIEYPIRKVRYSIWGIPLPPMLARAALCSGLESVGAIPTMQFYFGLHLSGKNKIVTFAEQEIRP